MAIRPVVVLVLQRLGDALTKGALLKDQKLRALALNRECDPDQSIFGFDQLMIKCVPIDGMSLSTARLIPSSGTPWKLE